MLRGSAGPRSLEPSEHHPTNVSDLCLKKTSAQHLRKTGWKAQEEQEDTRREGRTEPARLYSQRAPRQQKADQDQAPEESSCDSLATWRGLQEKWAVSEKSLARRRAPERTRASSESGEPVFCGKRCRRCSTLKGKAGLEETHPVCRRESRHLAVLGIQNAVFFGHHFTYSLGRVQSGTLRGWRLPRVAARAVRRSVRAAQLPRVWKLEWSRVWVPGMPI